MIAVKLLLAPAFVVGASLTARRFGMLVGGIVGGLPVVAGPILLAFALDQGEAFAADAAVGTLLGLISLSAFVVVYARVAPRAPWPLCLAAGWSAFLTATAALSALDVAPPVALAAACATFVVALRLLPPATGATGTPPPATGVTVAPPPGAGAAVAPPSRTGATVTPSPATGAAVVPPPSWDLAARAASALVLVLALTSAAAALGPGLSGLLAPFPIIASILAAFTHAQHGASAAQRILRGLVLGFFAFALFCFAVAETVDPLGIAAAFALAALAAVLTQGLLLRRLTAARE